MSFCVDQIVLLAGSIYTGINAPTAQSVGYVSGWLTSSGGMLGDINNRLGTCFYLSGAAPCIVGGFGVSEGAIATLSYMMAYYRGRALAVLAAGPGWTNIREGDTSISREGSRDYAREYRGLAAETEKSLDGAVHDWKLNHTVPTQVTYEQLASWPSPS